MLAQYNQQTKAINNYINIKSKFSTASLKIQTSIKKIVVEIENISSKQSTYSIVITSEQ